MSGKNILINMINNNKLPNMSDVLTDWEISIQANYITQENIDGDIVEISHTQELKGVLQPLKPQQVELKPEGQRNWDWYQLHVKQHYKPLRVAQIVVINSHEYKVMAVRNCDLYGFIEYHLVKDFE